MSENHNPPSADEQKDNNTSDSSQDNQQLPRKRPGKKPLIILAVVVVMLLVVFWFWFSTRNIETTDDAFTEGDAVTIAPKASGYVVQLLVKDNQRVKNGDLLVLIDPRDNDVQRDQARAQANLLNAQADYRRQRGVDPRATSQRISIPPPRSYARLKRSCKAPKRRSK